MKQIYRHVRGAMAAKEFYLVERQWDIMSRFGWYSAVGPHVGGLYWSLVLSRRPLPHDDQTGMRLRNILGRCTTRQPAEKAKVRNKERRRRGKNHDGTTHVRITDTTTILTASGSPSSMHQNPTQPAQVPLQCHVHSSTSTIYPMKPPCHHACSRSWQ